MATGWASIFTQAPDQRNNDYEMFMEKIRNTTIKNPSIDKNLALFQENGSFSDIDYDDTQMTNWTPIKHIERLSDFGYAYTNEKNKYYQNEDLYQKIVKGLEYWYDVDSESDNWWHNQISEPQKLGVLLIQMRIGKKQIPQELETKILKRIQETGGDPAKWTGANRTDIALHWIYRSCLTQNEADLKTAIDNVFNPVVYTTEEGFQHDNSYFQHGEQLYIGGYGDEILKGVTQVASYALGTQYQLDKEKVELLSKFMRETYYRAVRGQNMSFDVVGRSVSRPGLLNKRTTATYAKRMIDIDPTHADEYKAIIARLNRKQPADYQVTASHTHYFRGDYSLHVRPQYNFDVRLASTRTKKCEYGNKENLKTYFMSDGCTNITQTGDEYFNIFPVWNWCHIPGTTAPQLEKVPMDPKAWGVLGTSTYAGGVSDSIYGATAYAYMDTNPEVNTGAKKSWYFFDNEVVCLGAGIQSTSTYPVHTTVNQCFLKGGILVDKGDKEETLANGSHTLQAPQWVLHDKIGYFFPQKEEVFLTAQTQSGRWYDINTSKSKKEEKMDVFTLGINHGVGPKDGSYAYIVVPGKTSAQEMKAYQKKNAIEILSNNPKIQAVRNTKLNVWMVTFFEAGTFKHKELSVTVDKPCVLMVKDINAKSVNLHIADPGQTQSPIQVELKIGKKKQVLTADFSQTGIYAGATKQYTVKL
ncbi:polysaccharide lyase family 8, super-sandwich domain protein [Phocaeicola plebeius DSM 17135]|uniref:Polysaccharide lyase family 8, super-sandwich domain protein n=2 Tax=Phocaeicola plebeius TaxID=310297 RepID=B5D0E6_PHOPM|nr:polysaccharide lyase family 8, super-sandwich domain protein [Phocaeicola plebeius DSM 17135]